MHNAPAALENSLAALQMIQRRVTIWPAILLPGKNPSPAPNGSICSHRNMFMNVVCPHGQEPTTACSILPVSGLCLTTK